MFYVITYDIPSDKRRKKIANLLEGYGRRVQYSVFECSLSPKQYRELQQRLQQRIEPQEDSIRFYPLTQHVLHQIEAWGNPPPFEHQGSTII
ncbi:CRISPR-associated endonuclease Cas2 [Geitlerinema sp. P-1104]|uniref:CRISPR-associated endonuclease Cas2 n=1 Tax=Geitlerinema sp. P-1104 TaxID=2546230 RepID=UPI001476CAA0|nr:CRISPR-associated endonuclease Cas2 [Geitlerinema sp. P-1104]NMG59497.1 CRISPR-associated endonuclease Cas2 [Geitlerinema sp. P-1104]